MPRVEVGEHESLDNALKRFKRDLQKSGVLKEVRRHEHYEKPSERRRKELAESRRRQWRRERSNHD